MNNAPKYYLVAATANSPARVGFAGDPFEFGPADIGTDRPVIDPDAANAAERNARATEDESRRPQ